MAKSVVSMAKVWEMRRLVLDGWKVKEIATKCKVSEATVRNYTKAERASLT